MKAQGAFYIFTLLSLLFVSICYADVFEDALQYYKSAEFKKSKDLLKTIADQKGKNASTAILYLALIETAYRNTNKVDEYLKRLKEIDPYFDFSKFPDITPVLQDRIDKLIDTYKPVVEPPGIKKKYIIGDTLSFQIKAKDDVSVSKIFLRIKKAEYAKEWDANEKQIARTEEILTEGWAPGIYMYALKAIDSSGNFDVRKGSFVLSLPTDSEKPNCVINGIKKEYIVGDSIYYEIIASDNNALKEIIFEIKKSPYRKAWDVTDKKAQKTDTITTGPWGIGNFDYLATVIDESENVTEVAGQINIIPLPDKESPSGKITGIKEKYILGDVLELQITAKDDKSLKQIIFKIARIPYKKTWYIGGKTAEINFYVETSDWIPDSYNFSLTIIDKENKKSQYNGNFDLLEPTDMPPEGKIKGIQKSYILGNDITFTISAKDDRVLDKIVLEINRASYSKTWNVNRKTFNMEKSLSTDGWDIGDYQYSLSIYDSGKHSKRHNGAFELILPPDEQAPRGEIVGFNDKYIIGEDISFDLIFYDDRLLKIAIMEIDSARYTKRWELDGNYQSISESIKTSGWNEGTYEYKLKIVDESNKSRTYTGSFDLELVDNEKPDGRVNGILKRYIQGQNIDFDIQAWDNQLIDWVSFSIEGASFQKRWAVADKNFSRSLSISTDNLRPSDYRYSLSIADQSDNKRVRKGVFTIDEKKKYGFLNIVTTPWTEIYYKGSHLGRTPRGSLRLPAGTIELRFVNDEQHIDRTETIQILPDATVRKSFNYKTKYGSVNIFTVPWTDIYHEDEYLGRTPKAGLRLPVGNIRIRFVNKAENIDTIRSIRVLAQGQKTKISLKLN